MNGKIKVAHVYDDPNAIKRRPGDPEDIGSEWEDTRTIEGQADALRNCGYEYFSIPFDSCLIEKLQEISPDCVFNISEGYRGRDRESIVPAICRQLGIACTSSDAAAMGLSLDKAACKAVARSQGIVTADWALIYDESEIRFIDLPFPLFVKPNNEGSSMGIRPESLVGNEQEMKRQIGWLLKAGYSALIERACTGPELTVALLGNEDPQAFPIAEIRTGGRIYDKSMKSKDRMEEEIICPTEIDEDIAEMLVGDSKRLFKIMGLAGPARFDYKCDSDNHPSFLEVNPLPGLSRYYSVYTIQAQTAGIGYNELIGKLVELAISRHEDLHR